MNQRRTRSIVLMITLLLLVTPLFALAFDWARGLQHVDMADSAGNLISDSRPSGVGQTSAVAGGPAILPMVVAPARLARADYQQVYNAAFQLLRDGRDFRLAALSLPPACDGQASLEQCFQTYRNFNDGRPFYRFCAEFHKNTVTASQQRFNPNTGACVGWGQLTPEEQRDRVPTITRQALEQPFDVRNRLLQARERFGFLALAEPPALQIDADPAAPGEQLAAIRALGRQGVLDTTREIASIHLIYGQEFMVDALDYRFSGNDPRAELIIREEIRLLGEARIQFAHAVDVLAYSLNADFGGPQGAYIADFFTPAEYDLFGVVSERLVETLGEIALRYRQLGEDQRALDLFAEAYAEQYVQALAMTSRAGEPEFLRNGGWRLLSNLEQLRLQAQAIRGGVNPLGYPADYVPLQPFDLENSTNDMVGIAQRNIDLAQEQEIAARDAQRAFDQAKDQFLEKLDQLATQYDEQLAEICGQVPPANSSGFACDGGLMEQNRIETIGALEGIQAAQIALDNNEREIAIEQARVGALTVILLDGARERQALDLARAMTLAVRTTRSVVDSKTAESYLSEETRATISVELNPLKFLANLGPSVEIAQVFARGQRWATAHVNSVETVEDPAQYRLGEIDSLEELQRALESARVEQVELEAFIKRKLLERAMLASDLRLAYNRLNAVAAEHNSLVARYRRWLGLRAQANDHARQQSFTNPAHRIIRDDATIRAARSHAIAAQYAYLAARAYEYELLQPYPNLRDIYKARSVADIKDFMNDLQNRYVALTTGSGSYPYRISLARDLFGLTDERLDPDGRLSPTQLSQRRLAELQARLRKYIVFDPSTGRALRVAIPFATSLFDRDLGFDTGIWNNRIAGLGKPLALSSGVSINLVTRQFGDVGTPSIILEHGGSASYRTCDDRIVTYTPANARPVGYADVRTTGTVATAAIFASVNGNGRGRANDQLYNRSIAASQWYLRIDLTSSINRRLDLTQIEDIEIEIDTTGYARPANPASCIGFQPPPQNAPPVAQP